MKSYKINKWFAGIVLGIFAILVIWVIGSSMGQSNQNTSTNPQGSLTTAQQTGNNNQSAWYYVNSNNQCVQAPGTYENEDSCQNAMGSSCFPDEPNCNGMNQSETLYYINSSNQCVSAPHNPYSITLSDGTTAGVIGQQYNCEQDVGYSCYTENTCGGVGQPGVIVIKGVSYKLVTLNDLENNLNNPGFVNGTGTVSLVAIQGTLKGIVQEKDGTDYDLVIDTGGGYILDSAGTIDVNTKASNGFDPSSLSIGTNITAGGAFIGGLFTLKDILPTEPELNSLGLPSNTIVLVNGLGDVEQK